MKYDDEALLDQKAEQNYEKLWHTFIVSKCCVEEHI